MERRAEETGLDTHACPGKPRLPPARRDAALYVCDARGRLRGNFPPGFNRPRFRCDPPRGRLRGNKARVIDEGPAITAAILRPAYFYQPG